MAHRAVTHRKNYGNVSDLVRHADELAELATVEGSRVYITEGISSNVSTANGPAIADMDDQTDLHKVWDSGSIMHKGL